MNLHPKKRGRPASGRTKTEKLNLSLRPEDKATFIKAGGTRWLEEKLAEEREKNYQTKT